MTCLNQLISTFLILKFVVYIISANSLHRFCLLHLRLVKKGVSNVYVSFAINKVLSTLSCRYWLPRFSNLYTHTHTHTHWHRHKSLAFKNENTILHISLRRFSHFCSRDNVLRNFADKLETMMPCVYEVNFVITFFFFSSLLVV